MRDKKDALKEKLYTIIFETDTPAGKAFDILLIVAILSNTILIIAESVDKILKAYGFWILILGWLFLFIFAVEYILRIFLSENKKSYIFSFFGIIDLLAILPVFLGFVFPQLRFLVVIRVLRLLRLFSILKMGRYVDESSHLLRALRASRAKITVFLFTIFFIIIIVGSMMYVIEGPENDFDNIPESMYWAIVTVSTVGYGDISPQTPIGKFISSMLMIIGYGILAVPTGIISHELAHTSMINKGKVRTCSNCKKESNTDEDMFCSKCGTPLNNKK
ncbi:voltage-gated potassium channel [Natranaerovirga hydrolytica]|uniref:Voltage-gated potassium channel n=1 Tax=Natranaerovirga hydrolytica TaxID=680378 RepID=A0A4R1N019_9FIRM|nr:ion transporter [Natranaerovirga hydrolytica]TCK98182.1 voltage-gated potassium channel [Natranaerovirga hydrolytica]